MPVPPNSSVCRVVTASLVLLGIFTSARAAGAIDETTTRGVVELLVSDRSEEVARGEELLAEQRTSLLSVLLERIRSQDAGTVGNAAYELGIIVSPWIRGKESGARFIGFTSFHTPCRPVEKVPQLAEAAVLRQRLQAAASGLLENAAAESMPSHRLIQALHAVCETLGEVADDQTMDWTISRLEQIGSPVQAEPLIALADSYLAVPPVFRRGGLCGNSSAAEVESFRLSQELALAEAHTRLAAMWREVRPMAPEDRIAFSIRSWGDYFGPRRQSQADHYHSREKWLYMDMEPLVRLGSPAVDLIRAQQARENELELRAVWEVAVATITGREDAVLVRTLLDGSDTHRELTCEIIVGATSQKWFRELDQLQFRSGFRTGKASMAVAVCHRNEGIPALKQAFASNPDNFHAKYAVKELEERARQGSPREMRRYRFP